jgi:hypothetical protein
VDPAIAVAVINGKVVEFETVDIRFSIIDIKKDQTYC